MAEPQDSQPQSSDSLIAADVEGALLLLSYAAQSGIEVEDATAKTVARSKDLLAAGQLNGDTLAEFYLAFRKLAGAAGSVTVAGLRAAMATGAPGSAFSLFGRGPASRRAIGWYWFWTIVSLVALVAVQIYWVIGYTALSSIKQLNEERNKARYELVALKQKLPKGQAPEETVEGRRLTETVETLRNRIVANMEILASWNPIKPKNDAVQEPALIDDDVLLARTPFVLFAVQAYALPLLYGVLGAFTYVLRILSRDVRVFSYTPDSHIRYRTRIVLGTLSGLAVTWFFEPGSDTLKSLSPLALAFLAGYSVEILFTAMDRFVAAFSAVGREDGTKTSGQTDGKRGGQNE